MAHTHHCRRRVFQYLNKTVITNPHLITYAQTRTHSSSRSVHHIATQGFAKDPQKYAQLRPGYPVKALRHAVDGLIKAGKEKDSEGGMTVLDLAAGPGDV